MNKEPDYPQSRAQPADLAAAALGISTERAGRSLPDSYLRRGSLWLSEPDRKALGLPEPRRFAVAANTLVIANAFGFHARSLAERDSTRLAIYADSRTNPFNPWPGFGLRTTSRLRERALQAYRRSRDRADRLGTQASWHRIDEDVRGKANPRT